MRVDQGVVVETPTSGGTLSSAGKGIVTDDPWGYKDRNDTDSRGPKGNPEPRTFVTHRCVSSGSRRDTHRGIK